MASIEATGRSVPLYQVVEYIASDPRQVALQFTDITLEEAIGRPFPADIGYEHVRAWWGDWNAVMPSDDTVVRAWDDAWEKLNAAVREGRLVVRGFRNGSKTSEQVPKAEFPELWINPLSGLDTEYSGESFLDFVMERTARATIRKWHSCGAPEVLWADVWVDSGAEVLNLWPSQRLDTKDTGDAADLAEDMPRQGDGRQRPRCRGRPPAVDWELVKQQLFKKCDEENGVPSIEIGDGWRVQADAEEFVEALPIVGKRVQKTAIRAHVSEMLREYQGR
jgi:hypothetical protein